MMLYHTRVSYQGPPNPAHLNRNQIYLRMITLMILNLGKDLCLKFKIKKPSLRYKIQKWRKILEEALSIKLI